MHFDSIIVRYFFSSISNHLWLIYKYWLFIYYAFENKKLRKKRRKHENISRKVNFVSETAIQRTQHKKAIYFYVFFLFLFLVMTWFVVFIRNLSVIYVKLCQWTDMSLAACFNKKNRKTCWKREQKLICRDSIWHCNSLKWWNIDNSSAFLDTSRYSRILL